MKRILPELDWLIVLAFLVFVTLATVACPKKEDPGPTLEPTPVVEATPVPSGEAVCVHPPSRGNFPVCEDAGRNIVVCPSDAEMAKLPPCPGADDQRAK